MPTGVRPRLGPLRFLRAPPSPEMVHGYDHSQRNQRLEASYDSVLEHDLNDLVPPELAGAHQSTSSGSQRGSVYGGVAPTERGNALTNNSIHTNSPRSVHSDRTLIPPRPSHGARQSLPLSAAPLDLAPSLLHPVPPLPSTCALRRALPPFLSPSTPFPRATTLDPSRPHRPLRPPRLLPLESYLGQRRVFGRRTGFH